MSVTFVQLIGSFINGMQDTDEKAKASSGTLKIRGEQLIHYWTPIAERSEDKILVNITRYSLATGRLQKQLKELVPEEKYTTVRGIPEGYKGSLTDFLSKEKK